MLVPTLALCVLSAMTLVGSSRMDGELEQLHMQLVEVRDGMQAGTHTTSAKLDALIEQTRSIHAEIERR